MIVRKLADAAVIENKKYVALCSMYYVRHVAVFFVDRLTVVDFDDHASNLATTKCVGSLTNVAL